MSTIALRRAAARVRRRTLAQLLGAAPVRAATGLLLLDTFAAIGFAAGLALAIAAIVASASVLPGLALAFAAGLARAVLATLALRIGARDAGRVKLRLRRAALIAALRGSAGGREAGALVHAVVDEVEAVDGHVARFLPARNAAALSPLIVLAATLLASPVSALILAATLLPFIFALALAGGAAADESHRQFDALARLSGRLADRVRALPVVLAFRAEAREAAGIEVAASEAAARTLKVLRIAFLSTGALEFFAALSVALVAVYAGFNLLGLLPFPVPEKLELARAFFVLALAPEFYAPMRRLAAAYHDRQAAESTAERLARLEEAASSAVPIAPMAPGQPPAIRFHNVTIRYAGAAEPVIARLSFDVPPGGIVALIGPSGSGKSSLLHLLLGLVPLEAGQLLIDGAPLGEGMDLAGSAAWMGQAPLILPGTVAENIALAVPDASPEAIAKAAARVGLGAMLARRPGGLRAAIDPRGGGLSGGERRRIGLARALLKPAPLLLLDEPTAHLDAPAEEALIAVIARAARGRTTILATHSARLAAIADHVVELGAPR